MKKIINREYAHLEDFVNDIPTGAFAYTGKVLHEGRNVVKLFEVGDGSKVVVKKFRRPNIFNRIIYTFFRGSKAERAYNNAFRLEELGVNTPRPIAYLEIKNKGLMASSYLITEYTDFVPVKDIQQEDKVYQSLLANALVKFIVELHQKGIDHHDFNHTNVLYRKLYDGQAEFMLIDINRMSFSTMSRQKCLSSIKRICVNPDVTYYISQKYAQLRGWNKYMSLVSLAINRAIFERSKERCASIKRLIKGIA